LKNEAMFAIAYAGLLQVWAVKIGFDIAEGSPITADGYNRS
jgi:hypothetical protein